MYGDSLALFHTIEPQPNIFHINHQPQSPPHLLSFIFSFLLCGELHRFFTDRYINAPTNRKTPSCALVGTDSEAPSLLLFSRHSGKKGMNRNYHELYPERSRISAKAIHLQTTCSSRGSSRHSSIGDFCSLPLNDQGQPDASAALLDEIKKLNINSQLLTTALSSTCYDPAEVSPVSQQIATTTSAVLSALNDHLGPHTKATNNGTYCDENGHVVHVDGFLDGTQIGVLRGQDTPDCRLFERGRCHYGAHCKYNHPNNLIADNKTFRKNNEGKKRSTSHSKNSNKYPLRPDVPDCQYYLKTGRCNYGTRCRFNHPHRDENLVNALNRRDCFDFVKTGACPYGLSCKYNHPPLAFVKSPGSSVTDSSSSSANGSSTSARDPAQDDKMLLGGSDEPSELLTALSFLKEEGDSNKDLCYSQYAPDLAKTADPTSSHLSKSKVPDWRAHDAVYLDSAGDCKQSPAREKGYYSPLYSNRLHVHDGNKNTSTWGHHDASKPRQDPWGSNSTTGGLISTRGDLPKKTDTFSLTPCQQQEHVAAGRHEIRGDFDPMRYTTAFQFNRS